MPSFVELLERFRKHTHTGTDGTATIEAGAPTDADYLVGTAHADLSNEIVVGGTPGGELGGTWAAPTVDAVHAGSAHVTPRSVLVGLHRDFVPASTVEYASPVTAVIGAGDFTATEAQRRIVIPHAITVTAIYVLTEEQQAGDGSLVVTLRKGGVNQALAATVAASALAGTFSGTGSVAFAAGDVMTLEMDNNGTSSSATVTSISLAIEP